MADPTGFDKLHAILAICSVVGPLVTVVIITWLKQHNHPAAAQILEETLRAVVRGVEQGDHEDTKTAIQLEAASAGVEHVLAPIVKDETRV